jgi:hypothetical protein
MVPVVFFATKSYKILFLSDFLFLIGKPTKIIFFILKANTPG